MQFRLGKLAATFNRMMRKMWHEVKNIKHYVDDVQVYTAVWTEHMAILRKLFNRIKCCLEYSSLEFVGSHGREQPNSHAGVKLDKIQIAPAPETKKQVQYFPRLAGCYRKCLPNYPEVASILTDLTKKGQPNRGDWNS